MSISSTGLSRSERSGGVPAIDHVRTIKETAAILGIGVPSLRVLIRDGLGPRVTRLSARRIGIRDCDRTAWLDAQAIP